MRAHQRCSPRVAYSLALCCFFFHAGGAFSADPIRVGLIGLDTSHVIAFTQILNDEKDPNHVPGARVVAGFPGGSSDNPSSASRVEGYTKELKERFGVEILADIPALCRVVDAVLLTSVDGRPHLEQLRPVLAARKPVYIDKPLAGSLKDAREIARLARESGVPCFSASSLRYFPGVTSLRGHPEVGEILGVDAYSPCPTEEHHPDLYWYGIHGVEILFTLMGPGCESVTRVTAPDQDIVIGRWKDGRLGTFRGMRKGTQPYGATVFGSKGSRSTQPVDGTLYRHLVAEIVKVFQTGKASLPLDETLEILAFMSAADESKRRGGIPVRLEELVAQERRGRVSIGPGVHTVGAFLQFLGEVSELPVIHDSNEKGFLDRPIEIASLIRDADETLVREILKTNRIRVRESASTRAGRFLLAEPSEGAAWQGEPEPTPIVTVESGQAVVVDAGAAPAVATAGRKVARAPEGGSREESGVVLDTVPEALAAQLELRSGEGVFVAELEPQRAAASSTLGRLEKFDIVTHVGASAVGSPRRLVEALNAVPTGQQVEIRVLRKGGTVILKALKR